MRNRRVEIYSISYLIIFQGNNYLARGLLRQFVKNKNGGWMKTLIFSSNKYFAGEIKDFLSLYNDSLFYAKTNREAIRLLNKEKFDYVIIDFVMYNEFKLIKYINENYKNIKIILTMNRDLQEIISTIKNGKYNVIVQPFRLSELKKKMD